MFGLSQGSGSNGRVSEAVASRRACQLQGADGANDARPAVGERRGIMRVLQQVSSAEREEWWRRGERGLVAMDGGKRRGEWSGADGWSVRSSGGSKVRQVQVDGPAAAKAGRAWGAFCLQRPLDRQPRPAATSTCPFHVGAPRGFHRTKEACSVNWLQNHHPLGHCSLCVPAICCILLSPKRP